MHSAVGAELQTQQSQHEEQQQQDQEQPSQQQLWTPQSSLSAALDYTQYGSTIGEFVQDIFDEIEEEQVITEAATELHGIVIPKVADFEPYMEPLEAVWEVYERYHRTKLKVPSGGNSTILPDVHGVVPLEYFRTDFDVGHSKFLQDIRQTVRNQDYCDSELSTYLDSVEVSLHRCIQAAQQNQIFDAVLDSGPHLCKDVAQVLSVVKALRSKLHSAKHAHCRWGATVAKLARRKAHLQEVLRLLEGFTRMQRLEQSVDELVRSCDYVAAFNALERSSQELELELAGFASVELWCGQLARLGRTVALSVQADFVQHAAEAIMEPSLANNNNNNSVARDMDGISSEKRQMLELLSWCLMQRRELTTTLGSTLRDKLLFELKRELRTQARHILQKISVEPSGSCNLQSATSSTPAVAVVGPGSGGCTKAAPLQQHQKDSSATADISTAVGGLSVAMFQTFWDRIMSYSVDIADRLCSFAVFIHAAAARESLEQAMVDETADKSPDDGTRLPSQTAGSREEMALVGELMQLVDDVLDAQFQKVGVFLQTRQHQHQTLEIADLRWILARTSRALDEARSAETRCSKTLRLVVSVEWRDLGASLRTIFAVQTKPVVQAFHQRCLSEVQAALESDRWELIEVRDTHTRLLVELLGENAAQSQEQQSQPQKEVEQRHSLMLQGAQFIVVPAVLKLLELVVEYWQLCQEWITCRPEVLWCMVQLFRHFNQCAHRMVLGGRAVQLQTLRKINAMHLALCCQCCGFLEALIPGIQDMLLRTLRNEAGTAVEEAVMEPISELSKAITEVAGHRIEICDKLSGLLRERYDIAARSWLGTPHGEARCTLDSWGISTGADLYPHPAMEGLIKDIAAMCSVLSKSLPSDCMQRVFARAFTDMAASFGQKFGGGSFPVPSFPYTGAPTQSLGDRLAMDVAFLGEQLERFPSVAMPSQRLIADFIHHLQTRLPADDSLRRLHPATVEALRRLGKLPP